MKIKVFIFILFTLIPISLFSQWVKTSGPCGGQVLKLTQIGSSLFASTNEGIFISNDKGENWAVSNNGITNLSINAFAALDNKIYAGSLGGDIFESIDNGKSWTGININQFFSLPYKLSIVSLTVFRGIIFAGTDFGLCVSVDQGASWTRNFLGLTTANVTVNSFLSIGDTIFAGTSRGLFYSTANWWDWKLSHKSSKIDVVRSLIIDNNILYVRYQDGDLYKSTDMGRNWNEVAISFPEGSNWSFTINKGVFFSSDIWGNINVSSDQGKTWTLTSDRKEMRCVRSMLTVEDVVYSATDCGVFVFSVEKKNWIPKISGLTNSYILSMANIRNNIYAGTNNGLYISNDKGNNWLRLNSPFLDTTIYKILVSGNTIIAGMPYGVVYSADSGFNWIIEGYAPVNSYPWDFLYTGKNIIAGAAPGGVMVSPDLGKNWIPIGFANQRISKVAVNENIIYAVVNSSELYRTTNNGILWSKIKSNGLTVLLVDDFAIYCRESFSSDQGSTWINYNTDFNQSQIVAISKIRNALIAATWKNEVFISFDKGISWKKVSESLTLGAIRDFGYDDEFVYLCTSQSVWKCPLNDIGFNKPFEIPTEFTLEQNYPNPFNLSTTIKYSIPAVETRHPDTPVGLSGQVASSLQQHVTLKVFDLLGREIATLVNDVKPAGVHSVQFTANELPSGVYIYKIHAGEWSLSKKMLFIK